MRVGISCESSGVVRRAFRAAGHDAWSNDLQPTEDGSPHHVQGDAREFIREAWDLLIAHPTCTYLCNSGVWAFTKTPPNPSPTVAYGAARHAELAKAAEFFLALYHAPAKMVAIENPVMHRYALALIGVRPTQTIQPYMFGDNASKRTCLWLRGLPKIAIPHEEQWIAPRIVNGRPRWGNQTDSGQNKLTPSADRWKLRSKTYPGIAHAMAAQWGGSRAELCIPFP